MAVRDGKQIAINLESSSRQLTLIMETLVKNTRKSKGFSLIELLIVVAIILIIAAIAIPNLLRARISANESSAASSVRTTNTGEVSYYSTYPAQGYSANATAMANLGPPAITGCPVGGPVFGAACLIDWNLSQATTAATAKSGYFFGVTSTSAAAPYQGYTVSGAAAGFNQTGVRGFCSNEDGVIHANPSYNGAPTITKAVCSSLAWPQL
jgi:type IV pilus assembly protein PilA